jgi:membrane dipeptidase
MGASTQPVIFSHSNPLALVEHGRNVTDEQIRACAATGGVVCVSGVSMFVGSREPTVEHVARHAAYVAELVGVEHAGIGLDISFHQAGVDDTPPGAFDPDYWWPKSAGYNRALSRSTYPPIASWRVLSTALQATGMTRVDAALVMGGNMERVARSVWH